MFDVTHPTSATPPTPIRQSLALKNKFLLIVNSHNVPTTCVRCLFWEPKFKGGYNEDLPKPSIWEHLKNGWRLIGKEFVKFKQEVIEKFEADMPLLYPGLIRKQWELRSDEHLEQWVKTSDSDHGEGFSTCSLSINSLGYGQFSGVLDTTIPKDGINTRAGYCSIRTIRPRRSFQRDAYIDWTQYTHLVLRVRGDGRSYMINIATSGYFDQLWNDMYQYALFTRGGPYWQVTKIPFSKFIFTNKGRIQDIQNSIELDCITNFGITAADKINGPFCLEIDFIGCEYDPSHKETFAYEMYETQKNLAAN